MANAFETFITELESLFKYSRVPMSQSLDWSLDGSMYSVRGEIVYGGKPYLVEFTIDAPPTDKQGVTVTFGGLVGDTVIKRHTEFLPYTYKNGKIFIKIKYIRSFTNSLFSRIISIIDEAQTHNIIQTLYPR